MTAKRPVPLTVLILGLILFVTPGADAGGFDDGFNRTPVQEILHAPLGETHQALGAGHGDRDDRIRQAFDEGAYRWGLTILSEQVAEDLARQLWSESQGADDRYAAFAAKLAAQREQAVDELAQMLPRLQEAETDAGLDAATFERLLFQAQFAVQAESSLVTTAMVLADAGEDPNNYDTHRKRSTVAYPLAQAITFTRATNDMLNHGPTPPSDLQMDPKTLDLFIEAHGGAEGQWLLQEHGYAHKTARHLLIFELEQLRNQQDEVTDDALRTSLSQLSNQYLPSLNEHGFPGTRLHAMGLDATWWLESPKDPGEGDEKVVTLLAQSDIQARMKAAVDTAGYEADLLVNGALDVEQNNLPGWAGWSLGAIGLLVVLTAGTYTMKRHRTKTNKHMGSTGHATRNKNRHAKRISCLLAVAILVTATPALLEVTQGRPAPSGLHPEPTAFAANDGLSWGPSVIAASDDLIHFVWGECVLPPDQGCPSGSLVVKYRNHNPANGDWSEPVILAQQEDKNAYLPLIAETDQGLQAVWLEGISMETRSGPPSEHPPETWTCRIQESGCMDRERLSRPRANVEVAAVTTGPDGLLRVAWGEGRDGQGHVVYRQQTHDGWHDPVEFPDGGSDQWQPALAVDKSGTTHVVWLARPPAGVAPDQTYRLVYHATVEPETNEVKQNQWVSHPLHNQGASLTMQDDIVHLVYATEQGLYHRALVDEEWTFPYNVTRSGDRVQRPVLASTTEGLVVAWSQNVHPDPGNRIRMAEYNDGLWLRPTTVLQAPHQLFLSPHLAVDHGDGIHLAWAGNAPPTQPMGRVHYMTLSQDATEAVPPPEITKVHPTNGSWTRLDPVPLEATVALSAPLDRDQTRWTLNGDPVEFTTSNGILTADAQDLQDGEHEIELVVVDQAGNTETRSWSFGVDRTRPGFAWNVVDENDNPGEGWHPGPLRVEGEITSNGGSPAHLEVQAARFDDGSIVILDPEQSGAWARLPEGKGLPLPEGILLEITVRARDEAGNFAIGNTTTAGWDETPPELEFTVPEWSTSATLRIPVTTNDHDTGSPVHAEAHLSAPDPAKHASSTETTIRPGATGTLEFEATKDGRYTLTILGIEDEAGNPQETLPGPWQVGIDTSPPLLTIHQDGEQVTIEASDTTSGVASLRILQAGQTIAKSNTDPGTSNQSVTIDRAAMTEPVQVRATDIAGNQNRSTLHPDGRLEQDPEPDEQEAPDATPGAGTQNREANTGDHETGSDESRRLPSVGIMGILVALAVASRMHSTGRYRKT